jgi:hypothetical protein
LNITVEQLLSWAAPIDLAERYLVYINQSIINSSSSTELFYKCTKSWFGSRCQYSFELVAETVEDVVEFLFDSKDMFIEDVQYRMTNPSCYVHLKCDRGLPMCLDWREICNGQIDCIDSDADEAECFKLEMNECADDEYRCQNGMCIPVDFYNDEEDHAECLDLSDEPSNKLLFDFCSEDPRFRCEEKSCRPGPDYFSCGDGQCIKNFNGSCVNGRSHLMQQSMNSSNDCWINHLNLLTCESLIQFPIIPVFYGHVRFFYDTNQSRLKEEDDDIISLLPDYICYHEQLCDFIPSTFRYQNLTCRHQKQIIDIDLNYHDFLEFIRDYFFHCAIPYMINNGEQYRQHPSIYCCKNSSKCISKHRLMDRIIDCHMGDDDNNIDCLGGTDERRLCQTLFDRNIFHDGNNTRCIPFHILCEYFSTYPYDNNDEEFCENYEELCSKNWRDSYIDIEHIFCRLVDMENKIDDFSLATARLYPPSIDSIPTAQRNEQQAKGQVIAKNIRSEPVTIGWAWRCNRGLDVVTWLGDETFINQCFCPPSYYGDLCEYQNQRVSLTLKLITVDRHRFYDIVTSNING